MINQIKDLKRHLDLSTSKFQLTQEQQLLVDKLIPNQQLKERYQQHGLCLECGKFNTGKISNEECWCKSCNSQHFAQEFKDWTSGNQTIDSFIQKFQLEASNYWQVLEWIPYEQFTNIEYLDEGGFGKVYKAEWTKGKIDFWSVNENKWKRDNTNPGRTVILKILRNSQAITTNFLHEIFCHKLLHGFVVPCYGISQDPATENYLMVMQHIPEGNLRQCLNKNRLDFYSSNLLQLITIAGGLNSIHNQKLTHCDFHPGNILYIEKFKTCFITDLGLCRPANEMDKSKIYGVLPYVAPEVLRGKPYTQASDVYSFGMVAYEILTGLLPYAVYDEKEKGYKEAIHSTGLALAICKGLRPNLNEIKALKLLKDLIRRCWDADPEKRPTAHQLNVILLGWYNEIIYESDTEFYHHFKEAEKEFNQALSSSFLYKTHHSKCLDFKNLPDPQNSQEINDKFYNSEEYSQLVDFRSFNTEDDDSKINNEQIPLPNHYLTFCSLCQLIKKHWGKKTEQTQIEQPPK